MFDKYTHVNGVLCLQLHQERECPAYPVVCEKCSKDGIARAKVKETDVSMPNDTNLPACLD